MNSFGLTKNEFDELNSIAVEPLKKAGCKVWIFGSRAKGSNQKFSDVDLLFETSTELRPGFIFKIISELEDSNFPYKVDIVNILELAASYKDDILKNRSPV